MRTKLIAAGLLIGTALMAVVEGQQGQATSAQTRVAVIDMTTIFEKSQMPRDLERIFGQAKITIETEASDRKNKMDLLQKELDSGAFAKDSPDFQDRFLKLEVSKVQNEIWLRQKDRSLGQDRKTYFEEIYRQISTASQDVAQSQGVDIILAVTPVEFDVPDAAVLINQILQKKVVYASPRVNLTALVIERFDNEYLRRGGAATIKLAG